MCCAGRGLVVAWSSTPFGRIGLAELQVVRVVGQRRFGEERRRASDKPLWIAGPALSRASVIRLPIVAAACDGGPAGEEEDRVTLRGRCLRHVAPCPGTAGNSSPFTRSPFVVGLKAQLLKIS